jgi:hypothetical protein
MAEIEGAERRGDARLRPFLGLPESATTLPRAAREVSRRPEVVRRS